MSYHHPREYWAFAEMVERTAVRLRMRLELLPRADIDRLVGVDGAERDRQLAEITLSVLSIDATKESRGDLLRLAAGDIRESSWYRVALSVPGQDGIPATLYEDDELAVAEDVRLDTIERIDGRSVDGRRLLAVFTTKELSDPGQDAVSIAIQKRGQIPPSSVVVYDVGQGSASAICDVRNVPWLYFDIGGAWGPNARTYPNKLRFCWTHRPLIVLSHWDFDHYFSATLLSESWRMDWIVPDQHPLGPYPHKLMANIRKAGGSLVIWKSAPWTVAVGGITLARPSPFAASKNRSGLVLRVDISTGHNSTDWSVLLTGDVRYDDLSGAIAQNLRGLVASHHGASRYMGVPPAASSPGTVVYSFGAGNTYGHPTNVAAQAHFARGWGTRLDTPNGHVVLRPQAGRRLIGCGGSLCDLVPAQE